MLFLCPAPPNGCRATQHHNRQCIHQQASSMCCMLWLRASMPSPSSTTQLPPPASCMCTVKHMQIGTSPKQCRCTQQVSCCRFLWQPGPSPRNVDARNSFLWQAGPSPQNVDARSNFLWQAGPSPQNVNACGRFLWQVGPSPQLSHVITTTVNT